MPPRNVRNVEDKSAVAAAEAAYARACTHAMMVLWSYSAGGAQLGVEIRRVSIRFPTSEHGDCLVTVAAYDEDGRPVVGFTAGRYADDALAAAMVAVEENLMRWKDDRFSA